MRVLSFANGEYYHIYNRGVDKRKVFLGVGHYGKFLKTIYSLLIFGKAKEPIRFDPSVAFSKRLSLTCYCLMPNHYHMVLQQKTDRGITQFMHALNTSYTKFFNISVHRTGRLFEYTFKAVHIRSEEQLLHVSRYIHLNPLMAQLVTDVKNYQWSSYPEYVGERNSKLCQKEEVLGLLSQTSREEKYRQFLKDQINYALMLSSIKNVLLE